MSPVRGGRILLLAIAPLHAERRVWPPRVNPIGAHAGSAYLPCKEIELGSSPRCSTKLFPDHPTVGAPVVTREIQVRILVGEPICRDRLTGQDTRFSTERSSSLRRGATHT